MGQKGMRGSNKKHETPSRDRRREGGAGADRDDSMFQTSLLQVEDTRWEGTLQRKGSHHAEIL
jgi:hypothetical protein